jgi:TRAP-type C4-dicarboxylate transport system permease small subunit
MASRRHVPAGSDVPSVSRLAYFGGLGLGGAIAIGGYQTVQSRGMTGTGAALLELGVVAVAMAVTTAVWKLSALRQAAAQRAAAEGAAAGPLDTADAGTERRDH